VKTLATEVPTQRDLARIFGVSEALISKLMRQRVLRRGGTLAELVQAFVQREVEANGPPASSELESERIQLTRARRQLAEAELAEQQRRVVDADAVVREWGRLVGTAKQRFLGLPAKVTPMVVGAKSLPEAAALLEREILQALAELAGDGLPK
jgi:phage terminase Nu1 subunit (DNA packaging protein)